MVTFKNKNNGTNQKEKTAQNYKTCHPVSLKHNEKTRKENTLRVQTVQEKVFFKAHVGVFLSLSTYLPRKRTTYALVIKQKKTKSHLAAY